MRASRLTGGEKYQACRVRFRQPRRLDVRGLRTKLRKAGKQWFSWHIPNSQNQYACHSILCTRWDKRGSQSEADSHRPEPGKLPNLDAPRHVATRLTSAHVLFTIPSHLPPSAHGHLRPGSSLLQRSLPRLPLPVPRSSPARRSHY